MHIQKGFPGGACGKEPACQRRRHKRCGFNPWVGKIPGGGHGDPLQYTCLENPMEREAWQTTVRWVAKSWTGLKQLSTHARIHRKQEKSAVAISGNSLVYSESSDQVFLGLQHLAQSLTTERQHFVHLCPTLLTMWVDFPTSWFIKSQSNNLNDLLVK